MSIWHTENQHGLYISAGMLVVRKFAGKTWRGRVLEISRKGSVRVRWENGHAYWMLADKLLPAKSQYTASEIVEATLAAFSSKGVPI